MQMSQNREKYTNIWTTKDRRNRDEDRNVMEKLINKKDQV